MFHFIRTTSFTPFLFLAALSASFYLAVAAWGFGVSGFPLDDAWIHQTYARNLAGTGQLAFVPGIPSAGSTAPLWSFLLSLGYLVGMPFKLWTYGLGIIFLGLTGWSLNRLSGHLFPNSRRLGLWIGLFAVFEWHLVWAAVSGMETIQFVWLSVWLLERYIAQRNGETTRRASFSLGIIGGLLILTRPEGLGLIGLIGLDMAYRHLQPPISNLQSPTLRLRSGQVSNLQSLISNWLALTAGLVTLLLPYVAFHLWMTGLPFPSTLYAKQAEYGIILQSFPLWWRLFGGFGPTPETVQGVFRVIFIGPQILLLPGLFFGLWLTVKERRVDLGLIWVWWISYLLLYALQLPVTYQHGRYQMPVIVWVILLGLWGTSRWLASPKSTRPGLFRRVAGPVVSLSLALLTVGFVVIGAQAYGRDVRLIDSEMVVTARWLAANTPPDALIAAHDIGAIGYFAQRPLIDLAGLVTPAVIPIIRDEAALFGFATRQGADYLVIFPSWYPEMVTYPALEPQFRTNSPWAPQAGGDNMVVYRLP